MSISTSANKDPKEPDVWRQGEYTLAVYSGFREFTDRMGLVASFVISKPDFVCGAAFAIDGTQLSIATQTQKYHESLFESTARSALYRLIESGGLENHEEYTFEYDFNQEKFISVDNPIWWNKTLRSSA